MDCFLNRYGAYRVPRSRGTLGVGNLPLRRRESGPVDALSTLGASSPACRFGSGLEQPLVARLSNDDVFTRQFAFAVPFPTLPSPVSHPCGWQDQTFTAASDGRLLFRLCESDEHQMFVWERAHRMARKDCLPPLCNYATLLVAR
jgi:hypothetical protein